IGLKYVQMDATAAALREVWGVADQAGFDHLWILDHLLPLTRSATGWYRAEEGDSIFEAWTTLACMAALTSRVRIGVNVSGNLYRHPALLAKMAATVDHFCDGRLEMGIGAGHAEREFLTLGMPFPPVGSRRRCGVRSGSVSTVPARPPRCGQARRCSRGASRS